MKQNAIRVRPENPSPNSQNNESQQNQLAMQQQRQASMQGQPGMPNGLNPQQRNGTPGNANGNMATPMANSSSQQGVSNVNGAMAGRAMPGQQGMQGNFPNSNMPNMSMGTSGVPQAQMQALQNTQRMHPPDQVRMAMQKGQHPMSNQHQFQLQQQQINMASNLAQMGMNGMPNANMIAQMGGQSMNGNMNSSVNGMSGNASSPRMGQANQTGQSPARNQLSSGHVPQFLHFQNQLKAQHPDWTQDQITKAASDQLSRLLQRQRAMNAASGSANMNMSGSPQVGNNVYMQNNGMANSPSPNPVNPNPVQSYQAALVQQQRIMSQRQSAGSPGLNNVRPVSRSATPQNPQLQQQQSPGMQQAQISRN
jgi:chromatin modification-related protein VID21